MPWRAAMRPTAAAGLTSPPWVGTCVIAISFVRGVDRPLERGEVDLPGRVVGTTSISTPALAICRKAR